MTAVVATTGSGLALSGDLAYTNVPQLFEQARQALAAGGREFAIDLKGVTRADSAGLALLIGIVRLANASGRTVRMRDVPPQLAALAQTNKLEMLFGLTHS